MDIALLKTFLAVSETASFVGAAERLHITQSAVSLRVQRLEDMLGQPLFHRAKTGTDLTPSGKAFVGYALSLLQTWERARQELAAADGGARSLLMGGQLSLWPKLGFRWLGRMIGELPDLSIRAELGTAESLAKAMAEGAMQISLTYTPTLGLGLSVEKVMEDTLLLVAPWRDPKLDRLQGRYAFVDWGPEFRDFHQAQRADFGQPALTLAMGSAAAPFLVAQNLAAYLPQRVCAPLIAAGKLHKVAHSASFTQVVWSVWRDDLEEDLADVARRTLLEVAVEAVEEPGIAAE
jgi:LysR family transcriptional regulator, flagellar master operon regulator